MVSLLERYGFYEWLCHSNFSFLNGASFPRDYILRASQLGYKGIGIVDYDGFYGIVRAYRALKRIKEKKEIDFKLFYGTEIHLTKDHHLPIVYQDTVVLLAKTKRAYATICQIISYSHRDSKNNAHISLEKLLSYSSADIVCLQPMRGLVRTGAIEAFEKRCRLLREHFGANFYFVLSCHLNPSEDCWIPAILRLCSQLNAPFIFSQDAFFHHQQQKDLHDLLQSIRCGQTIYNSTSHMFVNSERCLRPPQQLVARYRSIRGVEVALKNSAALADSFQFDLDELSYHYPREMIPEGYTSQTYLEKLVWEGVKGKYNARLPLRIKELLAKELELIGVLNFADYFLTVWDIVRWARKRGILCQGRGSAANSAVCFVLGITSVDPSNFDLLFERFINFQRGDPPDIDVDFEHERREEVIQHIYSNYGRSRAAMIANVITIRSRNAIRLSGKALGASEALLSKVAKAQDSHSYVNSDIAQKNASSLKPAGVDISDDAMPWELWGSLAARLKGFPHHMGIHVGGFMLSGSDIDLVVPQEKAAMVGRTVIQWSKEDIEAIGFFKIDILALGMLSVIAKSFAMIKKYYAKDLSLATIPPDDGATYRMIQRGDTVGTFQVESRAQMSMLPRLRPKSFYDLVVQIGIIRPGPIQGGLIHPYLKRREGLEPITYASPKLVPILKRTLGVPIFQEQVMRIAMAIGDFSGGEADGLRRHMGAWGVGEGYDELVEKLAQGMRKNGIAEAFINQILAYLKGFADYGFPESHAVSFALISYASCYLKCHFAVVFFTALLNSQPTGFYSRHALIHAALRQGIRVLPISVNHSSWQSALEQLENEGASQVVPSYGIRLGFNLVRGLSEEAGKRLEKLRQGRDLWPGLEVFLRVADLNRADLTSLAAAGALYPFNLDRRAAIWLAVAGPFAPYIEESQFTASFKAETPMQQMEADFASIYTTIYRHPAEIIKSHYWCYPINIKALSTSSALLGCKPRAKVAVFGMVLVKQSPPTAKGMVFITLEDETGFINLVFTPSAYKRCKNIVRRQAFVCAEGVLQVKNESHSIMIARVFAATEKSAQVVPLHLSRWHNRVPNGSKRPLKGRVKHESI